MTGLSETSDIHAAYSADNFKTAAQVWLELLGEHMARVTSGDSPVLNWNEPAAAIRLAEQFLVEGSQFTNSDSLMQRFRCIMQQMLDSGQNLHHPHYIGHQVPASVPLAGLFDAIGSVTNQVMAIYEMGPWSTAVEHALVRALCGKVGWDADASSGLLTHGGSLANLTALLTARNVMLPDIWERGVPEDAVLVAHADAHYCVTRSAGILGIGTAQVVRAKLDDQRRIDAALLEETLAKLRRENRPIIAVSACACATPTGAFDPLSDIADACRRHDVWLHVDAAHGGSLLMSRTHRHKLAGIEQADSLVWDAHKMLFVPALCAAVLYREKNHQFETFRQDAPYLFDPSEPGMAEIDSGMRTIECTKRATGFGLWGIWSLMGDAVFEQMVDHVIDLATQFHGMLDTAVDFEPLHEPECNIVAFRHLPESLRGREPETMDWFQRELRSRLIRSGRFYIVQTQLGQHAALRIAIMNPITTADDLKELLDALSESGRALLREM
jgi:L-2,4-diaminobutyrate decarboxylase